MSTVKALLDIARGELGVKESPAGSNRVKYNEWFYSRPVWGDAYPWCMAFVQWCMAQAGVKVPVRTASCGTLTRAAKAAGRWVTVDYRPGDVLIYSWPWTSSATDHTGICEAEDGRTVTAIEGNTSVTNASNGGEVRRMRRSLSLVLGAWRPEYDEEKEDEEMRVFGTIDDVPEWYRPSIQKLVDAGALRGTDDAGEMLNVSEDFCRIFTVLDRLGIIF